MKIDIEASESTTVAQIVGELDADNCAQLSQALLTDRRPTRGLDIDLRGTTFIDSSAISALLGIHSELHGDETPVRIINPSAAVRRVLEITGLIEIFSVEGETPSDLT